MLHATLRPGSLTHANIRNLCWPLAVGRWPLAVGRWPLAVGCWLSTVAHAAPCDCFASGTSFVVEPDGLTAAEVCVTNLTTTNNCKYNVTALGQTSALPQAMADNFPTAPFGPTQSIGIDGQKCILITWTAAGGLVATGDPSGDDFPEYDVAFQSTLGPVCDDTVKFQVIPTDESQVATGWSTVAGFTTVQEYLVTVLPDDTEFEDWPVIEKVDRDSDSCWWSSSPYPKCTIGSNAVLVDGDNQFFDLVGPFETYVTAMRAQWGNTSCTCVATQKTRWRVPAEIQAGQWYTYETHSLGWTIGPVDVTAERDSNPQTRSWP
jgi:hypothetical protein